MDQLAETKVELQTSCDYQSPVEEATPNISSAGIIHKTIVDPKTDNKGVNIQPGQSLLKNMVIKVEPHPDDIDGKPNS